MDRPISVTPAISVVIPVYRDWERLAACLAALERQTLASERFEILVANNETRPAPANLRLPANARLIHEPHPGSYAARNTAIAASHGLFLAFTDSDCVPSPQWLERGLRFLESNPESRLTGPVRIFRESGTSRAAWVYDYHSAFKQKESAASGTCATANLMVAREVFDRVGSFNTALVSGGDTEWGERARDAGFPLHYDEQLHVGHPARATIGEIIRKKRRIAGAIALRKPYPTWRYFLYRLLPPFRHYLRAFIGFKRGPLSPPDWILMFFIHWLGQLAEGFEFLSVRNGWKSPNRR